MSLISNAVYKATKDADKANKKLKIKGDKETDSLERYKIELAEMSSKEKVTKYIAPESDLKGSNKNTRQIFSIASNALALFGVFFLIASNYNFFNIFDGSSSTSEQEQIANIMGKTEPLVILEDTYDNVDLNPEVQENTKQKITQHSSNEKQIASKKNADNNSRIEPKIIVQKNTKKQISVKSKQLISEKNKQPKKHKIKNEGNENLSLNATTTNIDNAPEELQQQIKSLNFNGLIFQRSNPKQSFILINSKQFEIDDEILPSIVLTNIVSNGVYIKYKDKKYFVKTINETNE